ncbi:uncharacterized protein B0H18DRAFT_1127413, partial [Fomitopsis serialis]|uniref:uncharacterized protein n=1 Tax=Fomitopsis serialis TaxID=139415 RepID=UPI0020081390
LQGLLAVPSRNQAESKTVVEKDFLHVKVSDRGRDGKRLNAAARAEKLAKATEARIKWLKEKDAFHHGNLEMPDPDLDPVTWEVDFDMPFHSETLAELMARQWWLGANPEGMRKENQARFDLGKPLSSNMIALSCSAILVALEEAARGQTINFDERHYTVEHDRFQARIDKFRRLASTGDCEKRAGVIAFVKSMDSTLNNYIRALAGLRVDDSDAGDGGPAEDDEDDDMFNANWEKKTASRANSRSEDAAGVHSDANRGSPAKRDGMLEGKLEDFFKSETHSGLELSGSIDLGLATHVVNFLRADTGWRMALRYTSPVTATSPLELTIALIAACLHDSFIPRCRHLTVLGELRTALEAVGVEQDLDWPDALPLAHFMVRVAEGYLTINTGTDVHMINDQPHAYIAAHKIGRSSTIYVSDSSDAESDMPSLESVSSCL